MNFSVSVSVSKNKAAMPIAGLYNSVSEATLDEDSETDQSE